MKGFSKGLVPFVSALVCGFFVTAVHAEQVDLIVRLKPGAKINMQMKQLEQFGSFESKSLVSSMGVYQIKGSSQLEEKKLRLVMSTQGAVKYVQKNHRITFRTRPNDMGLPKQWSLDVLKPAHVAIDEAWSFAKGGKTRTGEDVVVAVVDGGIALDHPDLKDNLWINRQEIRGNKIDDDGNGYVDDIHGWNGSMNSSNIPSDNHGTHVAGIIGAQGNNGIGICGVNQEANIMFVALNDTTTADAIGSYGYILKQKELYLSSGGTKGANVVVTNSSFGIDGANCTLDEFPVWTDLYNQMGRVGILSAIAVPNQGWDIDRIGDVPSACPSDYIISVTNVDGEGMLSTMKDWNGNPKKNSKGEYMYQAGYGLTTVDIGAPGEEIYSTVAADWDPMTGKKVSYLEYSGTSMATPHVAGTVALMMSAASEFLLHDYKTDPATTALLIKDMLLTAGTKTSLMDGKTLTGAQLNTGAAVRAAAQY